MSARVTQRYKLFELLSTGEPVEVEKIAETLGVEKTSVTVYINAMKRIYKAEVESISVEVLIGKGNRKTRRVTHYRLVNSIDVPKHRVNTQYRDTQQVVDGSAVPILDPDNNLTKVTDAEIEDIKLDLVGAGRFGAVE